MSKNSMELPVLKNTLYSLLLHYKYALLSKATYIALQFELHARN